MLQFDPGVRIGYFGLELAIPMRLASVWALTYNKPVIVFSVQDKTHNPGSLHPFGLAIDFDVVGNVKADLDALYAWLRVWIPAGYDVVFEDTHVHVEWDMKRPNALPTSIPNPA